MQKLESQRRPLTPEEVNRLHAERSATGCGPVTYLIFVVLFFLIWFSVWVVNGAGVNLAGWLLIGAAIAGVMMSIFAMSGRSEKRQATRVLRDLLQGACSERYEISANAFVVFEQLRDDDDDDDDDDDESAEYAFALNDGRVVFIHGREFRKNGKFPCLDFSLTQIFDGYGRVLRTSIECRGPKARPQKTIPAEITKTLEMPGHLEVRHGTLASLETDLKRAAPEVPETYNYTRDHGILRKVDTEKWRKFLLDNKVNGRAASLWSKYAKPNIRLIPKPFLVEDTTAPLTSKFGGLPDLPKGMAWPTFVAETFVVSPHSAPRKTSSQVRPVTFVAQINLADIARAGCDLPLPETGLLLFFYDAEWVSCGLTSAENIGARVVFAPEETASERQSISTVDTMPTRPLECEPSETLPDTEYVNDNEPGCSAEDFDEAYESLDGKMDIIFSDGHAFAGWPHPIQNTMELECELHANGIVTNPDGYREARARGLDRNAAAWRLLLQLDSSDIPEWKWGDAGKVYFLCREQDIAERRFERCCVIQQMY